jgi:hypothetical protein
VGTLSANVSKTPGNHAIFQMVPADLMQINLTTTVGESAGRWPLRCGLVAAPWSTMNPRFTQT